MIKSAVLTIPVGLAVSFFSLSAKADLSWVNADLPAGGCATSIGVGPNDVPWVTGCEPGPDHVVYYLDHPGSNCGVIGCPAQWHATNGRAAKVSVNINGDSFAIVSDGSLFANGGEGTDTSDSFWEVSPSFNGPLKGFVGGCVSSVAPGQFSSNVERFVSPPQSTTDPFFMGKLWALGCDASANKGVFTLRPNLFNPSSASWQNVQGSATAIAMFNAESGGGGLCQTPWVLNSTGSAFEFEGAGFIPAGPPGFASALTDHFVLSTTFAWGHTPGGPAVYRYDDLHRSWTKYVGGYAPNGLPIKQIASSEAFQADIGVVGPSRLWALDSAGNIYYASFNPTPPK